MQSLVSIWFQPCAGLLLRELGREAADVLAAHAGEVAPPAFMAQVSIMWWWVVVVCVCVGGSLGTTAVASCLQPLRRPCAPRPSMWEAMACNAFGSACFAYPPSSPALQFIRLHAPSRFTWQFDDEADVAAVWREVWEESTASSGAGLRLHMGEVLQVRHGGLAGWCAALQSAPV